MLLPTGIRLLILLALSLFLGKVSTANIQGNVHDGRMHITCGTHASLQRLSSTHSNRHEDREWWYSCRSCQRGIKIRGCRWSGFINDFDAPFLYQCPRNSFINGFRSFHSNRHEDRRWRVQCCYIKGRERDNCYFTRYLNRYDGRLDYTVPAGQFIHGIHGIHHNRYEDRIYAIEVCNFVKKCKRH